MSSPVDRVREPDDVSRYRLPTAQLVLVAVLLAAPVVALCWVSSYAKPGPKLWGFPFFFWYQFLWVFLCSGMTYGAYRLTLSARRKGGDR